MEHTPILGSVHGNQSDDAAMIAKVALDNKKGEHIKTIPLEGSYADALVIATGTSSTHVSALATEVVDYLHKAGHVVDHVEGTPNNQWVIIDAGAVVVHIFTEDTRRLYNIEKLHAANDIDWDDEDEQEDDQHII